MKVKSRDKSMRAEEPESGLVAPGICALAIRKVHLTLETLLPLASVSRSLFQLWFQMPLLTTAFCNKREFRATIVIIL